MTGRIQKWRIAGRPAARRLQVALAFLLLSPALALAGPHQDTKQSMSGVYFAVLRSYQGGKFASAASAIAGWAERDLRMMQNELMKMRVVDGQPGPGEISTGTKAAAVILHTDAAFNLLSAEDWNRGTLHLDIAQLLLATGRSSYNASVFADELQAGFERDLIPRFSGTWLLAVTQSLTGLLAHDVGRRLLQTIAGGHELILRGSWLKLIVADGCLEEGSAFVEARERATGAVTGHGRVSVRDARRRAEAAFRRALQLDPASDVARLRLGHVLAEQGRLSEAAHQLELVFGGATSVQIRYLAALFLGGVTEQRGTPEAAVRWYRQALAIDASGQAARVALAAALEKGGDLTSVAETLQAFIGHQPRANSPGDPWTVYPRGQFEEGEDGMRRLRMMVLNK